LIVIKAAGAYIGVNPIGGLRSENQQDWTRPPCGRAARTPGISSARHGATKLRCQLEAARWQAVPPPTVEGW